MQNTNLPSPPSPPNLPDPPETNNETPEISLAVNKIQKTLLEDQVCLQVLPVRISNGNKSIVVNALIDSGSDSTLIAQSVSNYLNLNGQEQSIVFTNAINQTSNIKSKLVNFSLSSKLHPSKIKFENVWVVNEHNLMTYKNKQNFYKKFEHLKDINFDTIRSTDVSLLIGGDMPELHLASEIRKGNKNEPIGIRLSLGWVLLGGNNKRKHVLNSNRICVCESNINESLKQFWQIESYGTNKENCEVLLPKSEQKAIEMLNKTVVKDNSGHFHIGLLWKNENSKLYFNRETAVSRLKSLENKFKKQPEF